MGLKKAAEATLHLQVEAKQRTIHRDTLENIFLSIQSDVWDEFFLNDYRKRLVEHLSHRTNIAMDRYHSVLVRVMNAPGIAELPRDRGNIFKVQTVLDDVISAGSKTEEQRSVSISFLYAFAVEGVYKRSLVDCYIWEKISAGLRINTSRVLNIDIHHVHEYYTASGVDMIIFEGYDSIVRNAISHATFAFNPKDCKITYLDRRRSDSISYTLDDILERYQKIKDVYQFVLIRNVLIGISDYLIQLLKKR